MKVTPRKEEVSAIVELLEDGTFTSAGDLAKAVIKRTAELFAQRDWYAWVWRESPEAYYMAWGPVSSETEVTRLVKKIGLQGDHMALKLYSTGQLLAEHGALPQTLFCVACDHPDHCHQWPRYKGKCAVKGCKCKALDKTAQVREDIAA